MEGPRDEDSSFCMSERPRFSHPGGSSLLQRTRGFNPEDDAFTAENRRPSLQSQGSSLLQRTRSFMGDIQDEASTSTERPKLSLESQLGGSKLAQRTRNLMAGEPDLERPNRIFSGHRRFNTCGFTQPRGNIDSHANKIVEKLEEDPALMDDTPVSEQLRKEALRDLPQCLTVKRCVKMKLSKSVSQKSKRRPIGFWKRTKYKFSINYTKFVSNVKHFNYFELWQGSLKNIEGHFGSGYASYFKFLRFLFVMNFIIACISLGLLVVPQIIEDTTGNSTRLPTFDYTNIFIGDGFFVDTVLYYGHYASSNSLHYQMPAAYFSVNIILYSLSLLVLAVSVAALYRRNFIETEGGLQNVYANRIFCGWDYGIATKEAAELKSSSIYNELKELLSEERKDFEERSCLVKFWTYSIQIIVNILVLVILAAVGWLTWVLLEKFSTKEHTIVVTGIITNLLIMILPPVFSYISRYEDYKNPRVALYITLIRTYLLGSVIVGVILTYWLQTSKPENCWENDLASEIYRLIIFDFIFSVVLTAIFDVSYFLLSCLWSSNPRTEFNVARHTLQIIYNQGLFWVGFYYSPILPAMVTLKMFIIWYVRQGCVRKFCKPPQKTWRAAQAQTWFMVMIFISLLMIVALHLYTMTSVRSSMVCGPFTEYNFTYEILTNRVSDFQHTYVGGLVMNVFKPGGVALLMVALMVWIYYSKEQAVASREQVKMLRETLAWLAIDKKTLVEWYNNLSKDNINPHFRDNRFVDPSRIQPHEYVENYANSGDNFGARFRNS